MAEKKFSEERQRVTGERSGKQSGERENGQQAGGEK